MHVRSISLILLTAAVAGCSAPTNVQRPSAVATPAGDTAHSVGYIPPWNFMSLGTAGVDTFLQQHPTYDGRGVVILILDTGVDPSIPGLQKTTTGLPKVIDVVDFSRSNVVHYVPATITGAGALQTASVSGVPVHLRDIHMLDPQPVDGRWYIGEIDESRYRNSTVRDFDGDGSSRTVFASLLYRTADGWRVVVDTDGDSSLAGETPVGTYRETLQTFEFRQRDGGSKSPLTFAANIDSAAREVSFHYDMNVHGTHVAGIAAGFGINGEQGYNGIAPGAQIVSGKFSADLAKDITTTGGMKHAYEYAARLADSLAVSHTPVVVNMSFGIGSAIEGKAEMEKFLDELIPKHPNLYVLTSAGNEGPGLSTVGLPAAASSVISVGALLPRAIGRDSYNAALGDDILWDFSSRGGEVDKPDIVAPGTAVSTITRFAFESRLSGTSMASPYAVGVVALLLSAMRQEDLTFVPTQGLMKRALRSSATWLPYYTSLEQGGGVINVRRAYELLRAYRRSGFDRSFREYEISTHSPNDPDGRGPAAFWRSAYVPGDEWRQEFTISRAKGTADGDFFRAFELESTAPWMSTIQHTVYLRNEGTAEVDVLYDREKMKEPGLYTGRIIARRESGSGPAAREEIEFELPNTVIVPYLFSPSNSYSVTTPAFKLPAGHTRRFYFAPPDGAAALVFTLDVPKGSSSVLSGSIVDRTGRTVTYLPRVNARERVSGSNTVSAEELSDGIIEVVVQSDGMEGSGGSAEGTLTVSCLMASFAIDEAGHGSSADIDVKAVATGTSIVRGNTSVALKGYVRTIHDTLRGDTFSMPVVLRKQDGALWISPVFDPRDYNRSTDILARLVDEEGNVQAEETYSQPAEWIFLPNFEHEGDSSKYRLEIIFGFARDRDLPRVPVTIVEKHVRPNEPRPIDGWNGTELVPYIPQTFKAKLPIADVPPGYYPLGELTFKPKGEEQGITWEFLVR